LASVIAKKYENVDMILTSDIDMSEGDLLSLDRILTENAQKDAELIGNDRKNFQVKKRRQRSKINRS
ncbi:MAG: hypothetical protein Q6367_002045, partial [Candidatus Freyarchaeota archaeon]